MTKTKEGTAINGSVTFTFVYNADTGKFTIDGSNGMKLETNDLKGKSLYPFVNLYNTGNEAILSFDKKWWCLRNIFWIKTVINFIWILLFDYDIY